MGKILAIGKEEAKRILSEAEADILKARYLLEDYYTGATGNSPHIFEILCEIVTTQKLLKIAFGTVVDPSNEIKEKYYKVDPLVFESIKTSLTILTVLKEDLLTESLSMEEQ
jgi:hypothetical protein